MYIKNEKTNKIMRTLTEVFESIVETYNKQEVLNFVDLRDIDIVVTDRSLVDSFINTYNNYEQINYMDLRNLEIFIEKQKELIVSL